MLLSSYDLITVLCVDKRFVEGSFSAVQKELTRQGAKPNAIRVFIQGDGQLLHPDFYDHISTPAPQGWTLNQSVWNHFSAVKAIIQQAKDEGQEKFLFVEDDCYFTPNFGDVLANAMRQMDDLGLGWDMFYYGANHTWSNPEEVAPNLLRLAGSLTAHCVGIRQRVYDTILKFKPKHYIDKMMADCLHHCFRCYCLSPSVALQRPGYSHLTHTQVDYTPLFASKGKGR